MDGTLLRNGAVLISCLLLAFFAVFMPIAARPTSPQPRAGVPFFYEPSIRFAACQVCALALALCVRSIIT